MKTLSMFVAAALATLVPIASASRQNTSAWNTPSRRRFGVRRTNNKLSQTRVPTSFDIEQLSAAEAANELDIMMVVQNEAASSIPTEESFPRTPRQIATEGARAAVVACVSAAAIGGARHALEMIL